MPFLLSSQVGCVTGVQAPPWCTKWCCKYPLQKCFVFVSATGARSNCNPNQPTSQPVAVLGSGNPRLDQCGYDGLVQVFFVKSLADSTYRFYCSGQKRYLNYCTSAGFVAVPAQDDMLSKFVAQLASEGLRDQTIKSYMAEICYLHMGRVLETLFSTPWPDSTMCCAM